MREFLKRDLFEEGFLKEFLCKYGLIIFLMVTITVLAYQKEANEVIPKEAIVVTVITPYGFFPTILKRGLLSPVNRNKRWITLKDFKKRMSNRCKPKVDNRHTFEVNKGEI